MSSSNPPDCDVIILQPSSLTIQWQNSLDFAPQLQQQLARAETLDDQASFALMDTLIAHQQRLDSYTVKHQHNVAKLCQALAIELGYSLQASRWIYYCGLLHDLGKVLVPFSILHCTSALSDQDFKIIRNHVQLSYELLKIYPFCYPVAEIVAQHHERIDGSGYPKGLTASQMYPEAQILIVADIMESMSLARSYRPALGVEQALLQIKKELGLRLDTDVCQALFKLVGENKFNFSA